MEDNELNVSLGIDTSKYEKTLQGALKVFNAFQTSLNDVKLGFNSSQISELHKIFTDVRNTAIKEVSSIQKKLDSLDFKNNNLEKRWLDLREKYKDLDIKLNDKNYWAQWGRIRAEKDALVKEMESIDIRITSNNNVIDDLERKKEDILKEIQYNPLEFDFTLDPFVKFNSQVDNVVNGLKRTGEEFDKGSKKGKKFGDELGRISRQGGRLNLMGRIMSQIKNSIAAAINPLNLFRKGWTRIIMTDTSRFGATFRQIGENILNFVTPAFEKLAQWILNLLAYVNIFLKAVTGGKLDLFAKSAKSSAATAKNAKEIHKVTAGFDEINDIGDSGGGDSGESGASPLDMKANIDTEWAEKLKSIGGWINKHWKAIVIGIAAVGAAILVLNLSSKLAGKSLTGVGTGFSNLLTSLGKSLEIVAILGGLALVIGEITKLLQTFHETGMTMGELAGVLGIAFGTIALAFVGLALATKLMDWKGIAAATVILGGLALVVNQVTALLKALGETGMTATELLASMGVVVGSIVVLITALTVAAQFLQSPLAMGGLLVLTASISAILLVVAATLPTILEACGKFTTTVAPPIIKIIETINKGIETLIYAMGTVLPPIITSVGMMFNTIFTGIKGIVESVGKVITTIFNGIATVILSIGKSISGVLNTAKSLVVTVLNSILNFINKLGPAVNNFIDNMIKGVTKLINFLISGIEYLVNTLVIGGVNKIIKAINSVAEYVGIKIPTVPKMSIPRFIPKLDVGTDYVPQDMLAVIHQGEAVIPKEFNDRTYFGGGNEETNSLLQTLIEKVEDIEFNPYIRIKDVGEASLSYINSKSRTSGRSVI